MKKVITIVREQRCDVLVEVPDHYNKHQIHMLDADAITNGLIGLDWEELTGREIECVREATEDAIAECSGETTAA